jgi:hypothetical protein
VGFELLSSSFCVSADHRKSSLQSVTSSSGLRSGRMELLCPRLTSANSSPHLSVPVVRDKLTDLPGYCALTFTLMPAASTCNPSVQVSDFEDNGLLIQLARLYAIPVRQASALPAASFRSHLAMDTLARPANYSPCRASRGLPPPSECALPGAHSAGRVVFHTTRPFVFSRALPASEERNRSVRLSQSRLSAVVS